MADNTIRVEGNYNNTWLGIHSAQLKPQYLPELYKTYGRDFDILDFLWMPSRKGLVPARTMKLWEKGNIKATITLNGAISTGSANADVTFKIAAGDYDASGNPAVRVWQVVYIPQKYQPSGFNVPAPYQIVSRSGSAGDYTFTARPQVSGSQIAVEVPTATKLSLGPIQMAPGSGAVTGTTQAHFERSFTTTILREHVGFEGGIISQKNWEPIYNENGVQMGVFNKGLIDMEFLLDDQLNNYIFLGTTNDNASLVQTSQFGGSNKVLSGDGIWKSLDESGQQLWYSGAFQNGDYVTAKNLMESQGVSTAEIIFPMGSKLFDDTDQADLDYIKEYSGGSDLLRNMTELGFQAQVVKRNGVSFYKTKLKSLSNPFSLGNDEYELSNAGFMMPTTKAKVSVGSMNNQVALNNVELRFLGGDGEDRTRVLGQFDGMNGYKQFKPLTAYDGTTLDMLTEPMVIFTNINQCIQVRKEA
jgi:hypothetical protein